MSVTTEQRPGEARIKNEFLKEKWFEDDAENHEAMNAVFGDEEAEGGKFSGGGRGKKNKKVRGANYGQRGKKRIQDDVKLCKTIALGGECSFGETCKFSHDLEKYLESKPADVGDKCPQFEVFGYCRNGYKCRYLKAHLDENKKLVVNQELKDKEVQHTRNGISHDIQFKLSKFKYEFTKSSPFIEKLKKEIEDEETVKDENRKRKLDEVEGSENGPDAVKEPKKEEEAAQSVVAEESAPSAAPVAGKEESIDMDLPKIDMNVEPNVGPIDEERPYKKLIDFSNKTYLAPLTTVGNLPFRRICKEYGVDITCGEMAMAKNLLQGQQSEWALTKRHVSEDIFGIQICGSKFDQVTKACEVINNELDVDFVDLNMGCPIDLVFNQGAGSALPEHRGKMRKVLRGMTHVLDCPVTVKFRTGVKKNAYTAHKLLPIFEGLDIGLGTLHGRSRQQRYTKLADWDYVKDLKSRATKMPIYGNGDVLSFEDYNTQKQNTGVDGIMIGRGALIKPWLFTEIKEQRHWDISSRERLEMLERFCRYGLEHWGTDSQGLNATRRFLCEWQSFLYRYIPVGLLEVVPQKINERAPPFSGRDELETLMASPKSSDWVKLSELLLGPAPEDFTFVPKHKANSFEG
ncbi:hypothetical protein BDB00DRAFT_828723 [Zychaea mexicana]|uniref:uncharacterized protein n=1 Tax=Zychaea mexicana TaxID=64656 RepID=UPI0022FDCC9B|nr:uncharacterized protein BDB00DRAFT_828723 [Zychaea mexicana]KAI9492368.1 hypothetical protein BDB00DRAFT_828723 [Zychaea mexicana]